VGPTNRMAKDDPLVGIKAKTVYPKPPRQLNGDDWIPDTILQLVQAEMMQGKSVRWSGSVVVDLGILFHHDDGEAGAGNVLA
jgi:hypothetical protein